MAPTWPGDVDSLVDEPDPRTVERSEVVHHGLVWDLRRDTVDLGDGQRVVREFVAHPGAVAVLALDSRDRVYLLRQYRHPIGMSVWEPVAGLLDVAGESPWDGAARELVEEAGLTAARWDVLVDLENSPGGSSETIRCYLARDLAPAPGGRPAGDGEERDLPHVWVPLESAVAGVLAGRLTAPLTVAGVLAAYAARQASWSTLRRVDAPWPVRAHVTGSGRARLPGSSGG
ncbi:MAG: NUDIX domain-containing protein [Frankiales bacterium]|nr:NUDIX domain-containing protein [Frankiales bacterium]